MCFSGKGTQTQTTRPNPQAEAEYLSLINRANQVASQPLQLYQGPMVAGFTPQQMTAFNEINDAQGVANPYLNTASAYYANANRPLGQEAVEDMSPYTSNVVDATQSEFNNQNQQQSAALTGNAISAGAYGGDRSGVAQAALAGQQQTAQAPVIAGLEDKGYQTGLQAAEAQNQEANQAGFGMGYLGNLAENTALQGASAELQAGGLQQQLSQEELNIPYQQFEEAQQYPFQTTQWLANLAEGLGPMMGSTSTLTGAGPSALSQLGGLGMSGLGMIGGTGGFGSNGWLSSLFGSGALSGGFGDMGDFADAAEWAAALMNKGGRVAGFERPARAFGGNILRMPRPHFGAMRMGGMHMPRPHMRPSMHVAPSMRHAGFGMGMPGMHAPGPMIGPSGVPTGSASPVPGFAPGGGVSMAKGPSGVSYPVLPMPSGGGGSLSITPTSFYSPPDPSTWKSATAPGTGFSPMPELQFHPPWGQAGLAGLGLALLKRGGRAGFEEGGFDDSDDDSEFSASPDAMLAGFSGMGSPAGMGGFGPVVGPQYSAMVAPSEANAESQAMAHQRPPRLPSVPIAGFSPVPNTPVPKPNPARLPSLPFRQTSNDSDTQPVAGFGPSSLPDDETEDIEMSVPSGMTLDQYGAWRDAHNNSDGVAGVSPDQRQPGFGSPDNPWGMLTNAGLATMSGTSPYGLVNLGRGLLQAQQMSQAAKAQQLKAQGERALENYREVEAANVGRKQTDQEQKETDTEAWRDKQIKALNDRFDNQNRRMDDQEKDANRHYEIEEQNATKPNYQYVGTDQTGGNAVAFDTHTGRLINLGKLGPKAPAPKQQSGVTADAALTAAQRDFDKFYPRDPNTGQRTALPPEGSQKWMMNRAQAYQRGFSAAPQNPQIRAPAIPSRPTGIPPNAQFSPSQGKWWWQQSGQWQHN